MVAAQTIAQTLIERKPGNVKMGVVAFSDGGLLVQPPTHDRPALAATIGRLVPQSGTSLGRGILAALGAVSTAVDEDRGDDDRPAQASPRGAFAPTVIVLSPPLLYTSPGGHFSIRSQ